MKLVYSKDRLRLLSKSSKWDFDNPPCDIVELAESMVAFLQEHNGLGIAYNQLDLPGNYAVFAMKGEPENFFVINPRIVQPSEEKIELEEGCLSFPGLIITISRPRHIKVRFSAPDGETYTKTFANLSARIFQHEFSHLEGKPFWDGISKAKFDIAVRKAKKRGMNYSNLTFKGI